MAMTVLVACATEPGSTQQVVGHVAARLIARPPSRQVPGLRSPTETLTGGGHG